MSEDRATRIKRLNMRSWRRGMREMDMILGPYADAELAQMDDAGLDAYEALLSEGDQDLFSWLTGTQPPPGHWSLIVSEITAFLSKRSTKSLN